MKIESEIQQTHRDAGMHFAARAREPGAARAETCAVLNQCLVNCIDVRLQCKQGQWDMIATGLGELAALFAHTAAALDADADRLAAHITTLGGVADGRLDTIVARSGLNSYPGAGPRDFRHIDEVAAMLALVASEFRFDAAGLDAGRDASTRELLDELAAELESRSASLLSQRDLVLSG